MKSENIIKEKIKEVKRWEEEFDKDMDSREYNKWKVVGRYLKWILDE